MVNDGSDGLMHTLLRHSAIYLIARGVPGAINFLAIAIYTRLLSPQEYGQYVLVIAAVGFTSVLCFQWINLSLLRFVPSSEFATSDLLSTVKATYWAIVGFTALVGTTGILVFVPQEQRWLVLIALPLLWLQAWFEMNLELARAKLQPARYGIAAGLRAVSAITLGTALIAWQLGAEARGSQLRMNLAEVGGNFLTNPRDAVGLRTRVAVGPGQALDLRRLEQAPLIRPGDVVTMIFNAEGLKVSAKGKAEQTGYAGGRIRLSNLSTKREVWGKVLDSGTVVVEF